MTEFIGVGFDARAQSYSIFTQGEDLEDLNSMVKDVVLCHFTDGRDRQIRLQLANGEIIALCGHRMNEGILEAIDLDSYRVEKWNEGRKVR